MEHLYTPINPCSKSYMKGRTVRPKDWSLRGETCISPYFFRVSDHFSFHCIQMQIPGGAQQNPQQQMQQNTQQNVQQNAQQVAANQQQQLNNQQQVDRFNVFASS